MESFFKAVARRVASTHWKGCFRPLEALFPLIESIASDGQSVKAWHWQMTVMTDDSYLKLNK